MYVGIQRFSLYIPVKLDTDPRVEYEIGSELKITWNDPIYNYKPS